MDNLLMNNRQINTAHMNCRSMTFRKYLSIFLFLVTAISLTAQQFLDETMSYEGKVREYRTYIPASYDGVTAFPLLFNFHGGAGDIASQVAIADMRAIADTANFILVYPQALPDLNDGGSTNWLQKEPTTVDDVFFIDALIDEIDSNFLIDKKRIYACGYSLGGEFTFELACRLNERIAAIAVVARTMGTAAFEKCTPTHPTAIMTILGTEYKVSPYEGLVWAGTKYYLSAEEVHEYWVSQNNTVVIPKVTNISNSVLSDGSTVERQVWDEGEGCVAVEHLKVIGGGHDWPGSFGNMDIDASEEIWHFVSQYDLEGLINCKASAVSQEMLVDKLFTLSPNPVRATLTVGLPEGAIHSYEIYSMTGSQMISGFISSDNNTIDLAVLPPDLYVLKLGSENLKFVKVK